jgi:hypothetical protein
VNPHEKGRPEERPVTDSLTRRSNDTTAAVIVRMREILVDGARYDGSVPADVVAELDALLSALEDQLERSGIVRPRTMLDEKAERCCPICNLTFLWPGQLADHLDRHSADV